MNLAMLLEMVADGDPERIVLGNASNGVQAAELLESSRRAAALFAKAGVEHVGYFGVNSNLLPVALFGASLAGFPFVPVNYRATDDQLCGVLRRVSPALFIADPTEVPRLRSCGADHVLSVDEFNQLVAEHPSAEASFVDPDEIAVLLFTSGTTSEPKAAVLRHRHLVSYIITNVDFLGCEPGEAQLVCVPPYHIAGVSAVLSSLYGGRRLVYLPAFDPELWVRTASEERITHAMVVPTMLGRILTSLEKAGEQLPSLRHLSYGGGRMPVELVERTMGQLPDVDLVNAYGLTETSSTIALLTPDDHREAFASTEPTVRARLGSVGRPLPSLDVEVRGPDGERLAPGDSGEIWVRGEQVAGEYVGHSGLRDDGWFPTRDAGRFDEDGFLYVEGRLDDVIVRGAENISPGEIEDVLVTHPGVSDAAVIGVPDPEWGETVVAAVALTEGATATEGELQEWVRTRLRSTKTPTRIAFYGELPYSPTGKLLRRVLREELAAGG